MYSESLFSKEDFLNADVACKLNAIIMDQMDYCCSKPFKSLTSLSKKNEYNRVLNKYILDFDHTWKEKLDKDFNAVVSNYMSGDDCKCENQTVLQTNTTPVLLKKE